MPFHPDFVVTERGSSHTLLVVETKVGMANADFEVQLRRYMWQMSCPTGLLVSPTEISLYSNVFTGYSDDSVEKVGSFAAPSDWIKYGVRESGIDFERRVQNWLGGLTESSTDLSEEASEAMQTLVVPCLLQGELHAAGPLVSR